jgi:predicted nuclease of predicted toxin-antitoxin system
MKFLVDAQLPLRLARLLQSNGYDTMHTKDLLQQNATPDTDINAVSIAQSRIVVTKDRDFFDSFLICKEPYKLLLVTTGNITNTELEALFLKNLPRLAELFQESSLIELSRDAIIVHQ